MITRPTIAFMASIERSDVTSIWNHCVRRRIQTLELLKGDLSNSFPLSLQMLTAQVKPVDVGSHSLTDLTFWLIDSKFKVRKALAIIRTPHCCVLVAI